MGHASAAGMVEQGGVNHLTLDWHLQSNHFPPLPASITPVALRVIAKANRGDYEARVRLPEGVSYKGSRLAPVWACVEAWHLEAFLEADDEPWCNHDLAAVIDGVCECGAEL